MPRMPVDWRRFFATVDPDQHESLGRSYWDRQSYVSATTTTLLFFTSVRTLKRDGNLQIAGQFPGGIHFLVQAIKIVPINRPRTDDAPAAPGTLTSRGDDLAQIYNDGVLTFQVLQKIYGEYPAFQLLPGTGLVANNAAAAFPATNELAQSATWGNPDNRSVYTLAQPIAVPPVTNFVVRLDWAVALTLTGGNLDLEVVLDGMEIRPKQ